MKFLCLVYGDGKDWEELGQSEKDELLAQDAVLRNRGDLVAAVRPTATTVRAWEGTPVITEGPFGSLEAPLAGFGIIEAADLNEAIQLVTNTPCARAKGAVELRLISAINR